MTPRCCPDLRRWGHGLFLRSLRQCPWLDSVAREPSVHEPLVGLQMCPSCVPRYHVKVPALQGGCIVRRAHARKARLEAAVRSQHFLENSISGPCSGSFAGEGLASADRVCPFYCALGISCYHLLPTPSRGTQRHGDQRLVKAGCSGFSQRDTGLEPAPAPRETCELWVRFTS